MEYDLLVGLRGDVTPSGGDPFNYEFNGLCIAVTPKKKLLVKDQCENVYTVEPFQFAPQGLKEKIISQAGLAKLAKSYSCPYCGLNSLHIEAYGGRYCWSCDNSSCNAISTDMDTVEEVFKNIKCVTSRVVAQEKEMLDDLEAKAAEKVAEEAREASRERGDPVCGEDFCEYCGDCLACYGDLKCLRSPDGKHYWSRGNVYNGSPEARLRKAKKDIDRIIEIYNLDLTKGSSLIDKEGNVISL